MSLQRAISTIKTTIYLILYIDVLKVHVKKKNSTLMR